MRLSLSSLLRGYGFVGSKHARRVSRGQSRRRRLTRQPQFEPMEPRELLATFAVNNPEVTEGDTSSVQMIFQITGSQLTSQVVVKAFTASNTARSDVGSPEDFTAIPSTLTFGPSVTVHNVTVTVNGDLRAETDETFLLKVADNVTGQVLAEGEGKINDDDAIMAVGSDSGMLATVNVYKISRASTPPHTLAYTLTPYSPGTFSGGVRVASGDFNADGIPDIVTAAGTSGGPHVKVFSGAAGHAVLLDFFAYSLNFTGGVYVAVGHVNNDTDTIPDIITGAGEGGGPHVRVFNGTNGQQLPGPIGSFLAWESTFTGGARVAAGDVDGDGRADVVVGQGPSGPNDLTSDGQHARLAVLNFTHRRQDNR